MITEIETYLCPMCKNLIDSFRPSDCCSYECMCGDENEIAICEKCNLCVVFLIRLESILENHHMREEFE